MKIKICVPSFKRPLVETLKYLPSAEVYVAKSQEKEYKEANPNANIVAVEDKFQGNVCLIRNKILDDNKNDIVCIVDDDLSKISYWQNKQEIPLLNEDEVYKFLYKYTVLAIDLGVKFWGVNINKDKQVYREYSPFSLTSYIASPFGVHIASPIRYDERLPLKEDYDLTLQHLLKYRKVLRINKYFYSVKQHSQVGGCASYRSISEELSQIKLLQKKWGKNIIKIDTSERSHNLTKTKSKIDINPILQSPIKGI